MLDLYAFLDGKPYTHRGMTGYFKHQVSQALYPYPHKVECLYWESDKQGRATEEYQRTRRELGDDWSLDLTTEFELLTGAAIALGWLKAGKEREPGHDA